MPCLVSVIVPCYNHAAYIGRCIDSVLTQIAENIEIIVVDDGSSDHILDVSATFPPQVKFLLQQNAGPSAARNNGLRHAQGRYVAFLDADDVWLPGYAASMIPALNAAEPQVATIACGWRYIDPDDRFLGEPCLVNGADLKWSELIRGNQFAIHAALTRITAVQEVGGFEEGLLLEDWDLWMRILGAGYRMIAVDKALVGYRTLPNGASKDIGAILTSGLRILDKTFAVQAAGTGPSHDTAYALRYVDASAAYYQNHQDDDAERAFRAGVEIYPDLLQNAYAHYALVCARQPLPYKASKHQLDLVEAETRVARLIRSFTHAYPKQARCGLGELYVCLAQMARIKADSAAARRYALRAALLNPQEKLLRGSIIWTKSWLT